MKFLTVVLCLCICPFMKGYGEDTDFANYRRCFIGEINHQRVCYFWIQKNASMFLRESLFGRNANKCVKYYADYMKSRNPDDFQKIICVRDPLYRPISCYNEVLKLRPSGMQSITKQMQFYKCRHDLYKSFRTFLDEIEDNFYEPHISHQYIQLSRNGLTLEDMDYIFLFENLPEDFLRFRQKFQINALDEPQNTTPKTKKSALVEFIDANPDIQKKIRKIWAKDFEFYEEAKKRRQALLAKVQ